MNFEEAKGTLILASIVLAAFFITYLSAFIIYKIFKRGTYFISAAPGIITSIIIAFTLIPFSLSYPDPVGSGLTIIFSIGLMIVSNIFGFTLTKHLRK